MKTHVLLFGFLASLFAGAQASASVLIDPMDSIGSWQIGGGPNATGKSLTVDTAIKSQGTASLNATATYTASGGAYVDVYRSLSTMDFSANTFQVDFRTTNTGAWLIWRLGTVTGPVYEAGYHATSANAWETVSFTTSNFVGGSPSLLSDVNLIQLRVIGDDLASFPQTISTNFDNLQIVPEPSTWLLIGISLPVLAFLRSRRARLA